METENTFDSRRDQRKAVRHHGSNTSARVWGGLIIIIVGVVLLARQAGADIPHWLISWPMILIAIGSYVGVKHSFRGPGWAVLMLIGSAFLLREIDPMLNFGNYIWPIAIIVIGIMMIFRPKKKYTDATPSWGNKSEGEVSIGSVPLAGTDTEDYLDTVTIFGGVKKNIFSKTFRGGELVTIFGGTDINLTQADVPHPITLDITQIFGGAKLIVPPHWTIKSEDIVSIFGSVEDKRPIMPESNYDSTKVLILKGTNIFGGIDIKSY
jgi:hypothetical protein